MARAPPPPPPARPRGRPRPPRGVPTDSWGPGGGLTTPATPFSDLASLGGGTSLKRWTHTQRRDTSETALEDIQRHIRRCPNSVEQYFHKPTRGCALHPFARGERRAVHAQQKNNYKETKTWCNGLNPFVTDPDRLLHVPETWDSTSVVLGYGITHINAITGAMELECLTTTFCASVKAVRMWMVSEQRPHRFLTEMQLQRNGQRTLCEGRPPRAARRRRSRERKDVYLKHLCFFYQGGGG
jgi:hypothetical protein